MAVKMCRAVVTKEIQWQASFSAMDGHRLVTIIFLVSLAAAAVFAQPQTAPVSLFCEFYIA